MQNSRFSFIIIIIHFICTYTFSDELLRKLAFELEMNRSEVNLKELQRKLEVGLEVGNTESFAMSVKRILNKFMKEKASDLSLLLQRLEGFVNTG